MCLQSTFTFGISGDPHKNPMRSAKQDLLSTLMESKLKPERMFLIFDGAAEFQPRVGTSHPWAVLPIRVLFSVCPLQGARGPWMCLSSCHGNVGAQKE